MLTALSSQAATKAIAGSVVGSLHRYELALICTQPHAGPVIVQKFHPGFLQRPYHERERRSARAYLAAEALHSSNRTDSHTRALGQLDLLHTKQCTRRT